MKLRVAETCKVLVEVSETSDMSHDVSFSCCYRGTEVCAHHEGCGMELELDSNGVFEWPVEIVPLNARTIGKNGNSGLHSSLSELEQIDDMTITIANSGRLKCLKRGRQ